MRPGSSRSMNSLHSVAAMVPPPRETSNPSFEEAAVDFAERRSGACQVVEGVRQRVLDVGLAPRGDVAGGDRDPEVAEPHGTVGLEIALRISPRRVDAREEVEAVGRGARQRAHRVEGCD